MQNKLVSLTDRQMRLLPILATHFGLFSSTAAVRASVDAMIASCAENDWSFASKVKYSDEHADEVKLPERVNIPA